ncbi:LysR family transcriptional regulator [Prosthecobacter fluviatilis]|uniref:LysR family transcriptional regulator n=1 Tax=Prosthecobacter fluviatilis TaxID=445931 RepID=A0ABW0KRX2_9BACT
MSDALPSLNGLSLDRLRNFLAFAEKGSIAKAAPDNLARQALISRQIGELEQYFSAELTVRRGKSLALSEAGESLANLVRSQFKDLEDFQKKLCGRRRTFSIGAGASVLEWLVVPCVSKIRSVLKDSALRLSSQRSRELVESIRDGQLDFAIVRDDAISEELRLKSSLPLRKRVAFSLCASRKLLGGKSIAALSDPAMWRSLPFAANGGGGQLDATFRGAMTAAVGEFHPVVECDSMLQVRELIVQGVCAGLLPSFGTHGLDGHDVVMREFEPMKDFGRSLVLHWNDRQMRRRGVEEFTIKEIAKELVRS